MVLSVESTENCQLNQQKIVQCLKEEQLHINQYVLVDILSIGTVVTLYTLGRNKISPTPHLEIQLTKPWCNIHNLK